MTIFADSIAGILTLGLVLASLLIPIFIHAAVGGWKCGSLLRRVEFDMDTATWPAFYERLQSRLAELGFTTTANAGEFIQSGQAFTDLGAFTHSKSPKLLRVSVEDVPPQMKVQLTLHYTIRIVADTGESAYRDAVLDYVSGQSDEMKVVPNRSSLAVCTFAGGVFAWLMLVVTLVTGFTKLLQPVYVLSMTYSLLGAYAIFAIVRKPKQTVGLPWAICGTVACLFALLGAAGYKFLHSP